MFTLTVNLHHDQERYKQNFNNMYNYQEEINYLDKFLITLNSQQKIDEIIANFAFSKDFTLFQFFPTSFIVLNLIYTQFKSKVHFHEFHFYDKI